MSTIQMLGALELGLIFGLIGIAVFLTFRISNFPDLTVDGSFPLGAAVAASMIIAGVNPWLATFCACLAGAMVGFVTAYLSIRWKIMGLLASILTMTALYSINLRVMGRPNLALLTEPTIFSMNYGLSVLTTMVLIILAVLTILIYFLVTEYGLALRAAGMNARVSLAQGFSASQATGVSLALSNALVALAGSLFAQSQGFADISMGPGTIVIGLAAVIIGETLVRHRSIYITLVACVLGATLYRFAIAFALNGGDLGLRASDLNLITALLVIITLAVPTLKREWQRRR